MATALRRKADPVDAQTSLSKAATTRIGPTLLQQWCPPGASATHTAVALVLLALRKEPAAPYHRSCSVRDGARQHTDAPRVAQAAARLAPPLRTKRCAIGTLPLTVCAACHDIVSLRRRPIATKSRGWPCPTRRRPWRQLSLTRLQTRIGAICNPRRDGARPCPSQISDLAPRPQHTPSSQHGACGTESRPNPSSVRKIPSRRVGDPPVGLRAHSPAPLLDLRERRLGACPRCTSDEALHQGSDLDESTRARVPEKPVCAVLAGSHKHRRV